MFAARVRQKTNDEVPDPLPLDVFRRLPSDAQDHACLPLCSSYGDVFRDLEEVYGDRRLMFDAIQFVEFQDGSPDAAHCYIAFLLTEGTLREAVTFNWDRLVEIAFENYIAHPFDEFASIINDAATWAQWRENPRTKIVKLHGCASQYPAQLGRIVLTRNDLVNASRRDEWQGAAMEILFNNPVVFCGFSGGDYDACIPLHQLINYRHDNGLPNPVYYLAQPSRVQGFSRDLIGDDDRRHIPFGGNDLFATIFYTWIRARLLEGIKHGRGLQALQRPFIKWTEAEWTNALNFAEGFLCRDFPGILDHAIGAPDTRWEKDPALFPIYISNLRQLYLRGEIPHEGKYTRLGFDPSKDLMLVLIASALAGCFRNKPYIKLRLNYSQWGITVVDSRFGSRFQLIPYHGLFPQAAYGAIRAYLRNLRRSGNNLPARKVVVLPCGEYKQSLDERFSIRPILKKLLPGNPELVEKFIHPSKIFETRTFAELQAIIESELEF